MKKLIAIAILMAATVSCQKSNNNTETSESSDSVQGNFLFNNLRIDAATINGWLARQSLEKIVLTFHSADLRSINSNLTLTAFAYESGSEVPNAPGIVLDIASKSALASEANVIFSNNTIRLSAIRRAVSDASGLLDFDYLLLQPRYFRDAGKSYLAYTMQAIKNGQPVKLTNAEDECDYSHPSPPAPPTSECEPEP